MSPSLWRSINGRLSITMLVQRTAAHTHTHICIFKRVNVTHTHTHMYMHMENPPDAYWIHRTRAGRTTQCVSIIIVFQCCLRARCAHAHVCLYSPVQNSYINARVPAVASFMIADRHTHNTRPCGEHIYIHIYMFFWFYINLNTSIYSIYARARYMRCVYICVHVHSLPILHTSRARGGFILRKTLVTVH